MQKGRFTQATKKRNHGWGEGLVVQKRPHIKVDFNPSLEE